MIDTLGTRAFVLACDRLRARFGDQFEVPPGLRTMAERGQSFYARAVTG